MGQYRQNDGSVGIQTSPMQIPTDRSEQEEEERRKGRKKGGGKGKPAFAVRFRRHIVETASTDLPKALSDLEEAIGAALTEDRSAACWLYRLRIELLRSNGDFDD